MLASQWHCTCWFQSLCFVEAWTFKEVAGDRMMESFHFPQLPAEGCSHPCGGFSWSLAQPHSCQSDWWGWCLGVVNSVSPWALGQKSNEKFCENYWSISCWVQKHILRRRNFQQKTLPLDWWYSDCPWWVFAESLFLVSFRWVTFTHSFRGSAYTGPQQTPPHAPPGTDGKRGLTSLRSPPS